MNGALADSHEWTPRRLGTVIVVAIVVQVGAIWWFSEKTPRTPRQADAHPTIQWAPLARSEMLALTDPTLFSLAHQNGFSGPAWLAFAAHDYQPLETSSAPQWLALAPESLGSAFREFVKTNTARGLTRRAWPMPSVTQPGVGLPPNLALESRVQVEGALAKRGLLSAPQLPAWTNADILAPSQVLVLVDAYGNPMSAVLLTSSGFKPADLEAVKLAQASRFGSDEGALAHQPNDPAAGLVSGRMIFQWRTLAPGTNAVVNPR